MQKILPYFIQSLNHPPEWIKVNLKLSLKSSQITFCDYKLSQYVLSSTLGDRWINLMPFLSTYKLRYLMHKENNLCNVINIHIINIIITVFHEQLYYPLTSSFSSDFSCSASKASLYSKTGWLQSFLRAEIHIR